MNMAAFTGIRKSIFAKFTLSFIIVGLVPLLLISYVSLNTFSSYIERNLVNNYEQMMLFSGKNIHDMYTKYNNITKLMYSYGVDGRFSQLGQAIAVQSAQRDYQLTSTIDDFLRTMLYTDRYLQNVFFLMVDGRLQHLSKENKSYDFSFAFPPESWKEQLVDRQSLAFYPTHKEAYYLRSDDLVMTFARNLTDVLGSSGLQGPLVGTFFMDVSMGAFEEIFQQMMLGPKDVIYVLDSKGTIIYSNQRSLIGQPYQPPDQTEGYIQMVQGVEDVGWTVRGDFYKEEMFDRIDQIMRTLFLIIGACILSLVLVAVLFSNRLSGPIRSITRQMSKIESGNFNTQVTVQSADEVGLLARGFNKMVVRLQSYIDEVYVAQIKQKQAELNALKSQIRPHYLYNTLEVIRMSAVANDDHEVGDMILSLSHQLKYVLDYGQETVPLSEEKMNIEQYFKLMEFRYGEHRLAMEFRFETELLSMPIPKLSVQPLVENAIYHGIMRKAGKGTVRITAERGSEGHICITVDDDGVGMSADTLERVRAKLRGEQPGESGSGIGLKNVHDRLAALYGPDYGLQINSTQHIGTSVRLVIPLAKEVGARDESHSG
ncbi:cache domain-containing sensor histidine kinase [Paenibacillus silviterrae]|uniref:cache domain-containing sensor histidine kinase n=1 Tax=Paenibacillus silviterrae TaxID=3242194 RepID=UPI002542BA35|nr:sensor histidine kinase [Paenibacillus chinjuensis]